MKNINGCEYEISFDEYYKDLYGIDEWGAAYLWLNSYGDGVEYNYCIQEDGTNCCAIYKMEYNEKTDNISTDSSTYEHYEIDFDDKEWEQKLVAKMYEVAIKFFD